MRPQDLRFMAPGDRGPLLRQAAVRALAALDSIEHEPSSSGRAAALSRARRIAGRRAELRHLAALARYYGVNLPADVARRAARHRRAPLMIDEARAETLGNAILAAMRTAIEGGMSPRESVDAGLMAVASISVQAEGEYRTGAKLIVIGEGLVDGSPEGVAKRKAAPN